MDSTGALAVRVLLCIWTVTIKTRAARLYFQTLKVFAGLVSTGTLCIFTLQTNTSSRTAKARSFLTYYGHHKICTCLHIKIMFLFSADSGWPGLLCYLLHNETVVYWAWRRLITGRATPPVGAIWPSRNAPQSGRLGSGSARHDVVNDAPWVFCELQHERFTPEVEDEALQTSLRPNWEKKNKHKSSQKNDAVGCCTFLRVKKMHLII